MSVPVPKRGEGQLDVNTKALTMTVHTYRNLKNEKYFPKEQEVFINEMRKCALDIKRLCWIANNIKVDNIQSRYKRRIDLQDQAAEKCNDMIMLIETAKKLFHLSWKKTAYWIKQYAELRTIIRAWHDKDVNRLIPKD